MKREPVGNAFGANSVPSLLKKTVARILSG